MNLVYKWINNELYVKNSHVRGYIDLLENEVLRLKEGNFTEEEFQNLCHNKSVQDGYECFKQGCNEYQKKLFGRCQNEEQLGQLNP
jgi:hypothetical protein